MLTKVCLLNLQLILLKAFLVYYVGFVLMTMRFGAACIIKTITNIIDLICFIRNIKINKKAHILLQTAQFVFILVCAGMVKVKNAIADVASWIKQFVIYCLLLWMGCLIYMYRHYIPSLWQYYINKFVCIITRTMKLNRFLKFLIQYFETVQISKCRSYYLTINH